MVQDQADQADHGNRGNSGNNGMSFGYKCIIKVTLKINAALGI